MIIGITGNSGTGKSSICKELEKKCNAKIIDADKISKKLSRPGEKYFEEIIKIFGNEIIEKTGELNRKKLANIIFKNSKKKEQLDLTTYKYVVEEIKQEVHNSNSKYIIIDAPLLIEGKLNKICDTVIAIIANESTKIERICLRDGISKRQAIERLNSQNNEEFYIRNSNYVIVNEKTNVEKQAEEIIEMLKSNLLFNKEVVIIQNKETKIMQFKKLLQYNKLKHAFTLKPLDFGSNDTYNKIQEEVNANYKKVLELLKLENSNIIRPYQTHTNNIKKVENDIGIFNSKFENIDGLITNKKDEILSLVYADCTPIYIYDQEKQIIGNIHSGWQGTVKKIAKKAVQEMQEEFNCNPQNLICIIGPTIRKCHFEVQENTKEIFYNTFKYMKNINEIIEKKGEKYLIDTVEINKNLLKEEGVLEENIIDCKICTYCNSNLIHSYRKEKEKSGRNTALICLK